jgi:hypothetical protein
VGGLGAVPHLVFCALVSELYFTFLSSLLITWLQLTCFSLVPWCTSDSDSDSDFLFLPFSEIHLSPSLGVL